VIIVANQPPTTIPFFLSHTEHCAPLPSKPPNPGPVPPFLINLASFYSCSRAEGQVSSHNATKQKQRKGVRHGAAVHSLADICPPQRTKNESLDREKETAIPDVNGALLCYLRLLLFAHRKKTPTPSTPKRPTRGCACPRARTLTSTQAHTHTHTHELHRQSTPVHCDVPLNLFNFSLCFT
jgi:hypothetical protein